MNVFGNTVKGFFVNEDGFVLSSEALLICSVSVLGLLVGVVRVRDSLLYELKDLAATFAFLDQSYEFTGVNDEFSFEFSVGSLFTDSEDLADPGNSLFQMDPVAVFGGLE
jgi:hypothetical protein